MRMRVRLGLLLLPCLILLDYVRLINYFSALSVRLHVSETLSMVNLLPPICDSGLNDFAMISLDILTWP